MVIASTCAATGAYPDRTGPIVADGLDILGGVLGDALDQTRGGDHR